jgi:hypothetical protein
MARKQKAHRQMAHRQKAQKRMAHEGKARWLPMGHADLQTMMALEE